MSKPSKRNQVILIVKQIGDAHKQITIWRDFQFHSNPLMIFLENLSRP